MQERLLPIAARLSFLIILPLITIIHVALNNYTPGFHIIKTFIDELIPFNSLFAVPYLFMFPYITISLVYFAVVDYRTYFSLLASIVSGMLFCFVIYYLYPTAIIRPDVYGNDIFSKLVRYIYNNDNIYNCFPSIHVLSAYLPALFSYKYNKSRSMKIFTSIGFVSIGLSTLFVKQHYFPDAVASLIIGTMFYLVYSSDYVWNRVPVKTIVDLLKTATIKNNY